MLDKKIPQNKMAQTQQSQTTKPTPKRISPLKLLKGLAGAKVVGEMAKEAQKTAQKMGDALASQKAEGASELQAPELPKAAKQGGIMGLVTRAVEKARANPGAVHETRRTALEEAQKETVSGAPFKVQDDVSTLYKSGHNNKLGTNEKAIRELMWDRTPEQRKAIAESYKDRYGRDLWKDLDKEFEDPNDKRMMKAFREGDKVTAAAAALVDATTGQTSKTRVREVLERLSPEEASKAQEEYRELHPKGRDLKSWTDKKFQRERGEQVDALLKGDSGRAQLAEMQRSLRKKNGSEVVSELRSMSPEERLAFVERFNSGAGEGQDLETLVGHLKGTDRDQAKALLAGNEAAADAALIQDAVDGMGSNKQKLWDGLGADIEDPQERQAYMRKVEAEYNKRYGPESSRQGKSLQARLKSELGGENQEKALVMLEQGEIPPEKQMKFALSGSRKDGQELASLIEKHGPEKARQMYAEATKSAKHPQGRDLDQDIQNRLGGTGRYEAKDALKGQPETPEEKVARTVARTEFETSGAAGKLAFSDEVLKKNTLRAEQALEQLQAARAAGDERAVAEWTTRIDELTGYAKADTQVFRSEKQAVVDTTAAVAAGFAAAGAIAVTGGAAAPLLAMAAGATVNYGTRNLMAGRSYDQNNASKDLALGALEGVGVKGGALLGGVVRNRVQSQIRNKTVKKIAGSTAEGASDGLVGGAVMGAAETSLAEGTWENGIASGLGKVAEGGAIGGTAGSLIGGTAGPVLEKGFEKAGQGWRKLRGGAEADSTASPERVSSREGGPPNRVNAESQEKVAPNKDTDNSIATISPEYRAPKNGKNRLPYDLDALSQKMKAEVDNGKAPFVAQNQTLLNEAERLIKQSREAGRISEQSGYDKDIRELLIFKMIKDLGKGGVKVDKGLRDAYTPFKVESSDTVLDNGLTRHDKSLSRTNDSFLAQFEVNRILEPEPHRVGTSQPVKVYNAENQMDKVIAESAVGDMEKHAPELGAALEEIHYTRVLDISTSRFRQNDTKVGTDTAGEEFGHTFLGVQAAEGAVSIKRKPAGTGTKWDKQLKIRERLGIQPPEARDFPFHRIKGTIFHEAAHQLDRAKGVGKVPYSGLDGSPFGEGRKAGEAGKRGEDFVSPYAQTNPTEDFAETVRFVVQLSSLDEPDLLGGQAIGPALGRKLMSAAEVSGVDRSVLKKLPGWTDELDRIKPFSAETSTASSTSNKALNDTAGLRAKSIQEEELVNSHPNEAAAMRAVERAIGDVFRFDNKEYARGTLERSLSNGRINGFVSPDRKVGFRIDFDEKKELHFNWFDWSQGRKGRGGRWGAETFPGTEADFQRFLDTMNRGRETLSPD